MRLRGYRAEIAFDGERELPGGALVLVEDEQIVAVQPGPAPAPDGCEVLERPGAALLPGLIDAHTHLCGDDGPRALEQLPELGRDQLDRIIDDALLAQLRAGVTAVRDLGDIDWAVVDRRATGPGRPHVVASGPPITSPGGHCANMGGVVAGRDALRRAVRERVDRGVDVVKVMASGGLMTAGTDVMACQFSLDELSAVVDEAHRHGLAVTAHAHALPAVEQAVQAGVDGIEHGSCFTGRGLATPPALAEQIAAARIALCPTLGHDSQVQIPPRVQEVLDRLGLAFEMRTAQVAELYRAGVLLISGVDSGINPAKRHGMLPTAIAELIAVGLTPVEALASATGLAADACGLAGRTGRLRAGLCADLLLVDGDPFTDITALRRPRAVVARGRLVELPVVGPPG